MNAGGDPFLARLCSETASAVQLKLSEAERGISLFALLSSA